MSLMGGLAPTVVTVRVPGHGRAVSRTHSIACRRGQPWAHPPRPRPPHFPLCQAIGATTGNTATAPGWYMLASTLVSMAAGAAIVWIAPETNRAPVVAGDASSSSGADLDVQL
jgi:uncharacterized membrane protein